jgi:hypothetical protein
MRLPNKGITAGQTKGPDDINESPDAGLSVPTPKPASLALLALRSIGVSHP